MGVPYGVVVQADELMDLSTIVVAPTSTSVRAASFRPDVSVAGGRTRVVVEQMRAVDPSRLGDSAGLLMRSEIDDIDRALATVLDL
jgi:mRNA interferase MazF